MKVKFYWLVLFFLSFFVTSCLDREEQTDQYSKDAVVTRFYLYSDSVKSVSDVEFTIDEAKKLIYNYDSIDFGVPVDSLCPMIAPKFYKIYVNDTIDYQDTAFFDFTKDVKITVVASDKVTSADYVVRVNVHQVDPDTFIWENVNSGVFTGEVVSERALCVNEKLYYFAVVGDELLIYESVDGDDWSEIVPVGLDVDVLNLDLNYLVSTDELIYLYCDGDLYSSEDGVKWILQNTSGVVVDHLLFAMGGKVFGVTVDRTLACLDGSVWRDLGSLPSNFPVKGGAVLVAEAPSGKERVFVVGGIDFGGRFLSTIWSSEDGVYWTELSGGIERFSPRAYAAVAQYGDGLMLFGGLVQTEGSVEHGEVVKDAHLFSRDFGLTWGEPKDKMKLSGMYVPRYRHSAVVTPSGYVFLIGGRVSMGESKKDVWRGLNYASLPGFRR
jgi:hypothetical protein